MKKFILPLCFFVSAAFAEPFDFADFTWLNGSSRQKTPLLETKYFTGQVLIDANYVYDFAQPKDHTLVGSTSAGRTNEFQLQQFGVGGDFHAGSARGRLMTQFGMYSTMTPRNDASTARGQWQLNDAYRYISEAYGGYHWDKWSGINFDVGIFMSYVGLFSYYNSENWAYQASYTSANTPWFFNGARLQIFPNDRLKLELWLINGWQSYAMYNEMPGLGYQVLWRPDGNNSILTNAYWGADTLNNSGRNRFHTDTSLTHKYWDRSSHWISKGAFSFTFDMGCENGGGVKCTGGHAKEPSQYFISAMLYNRLWFADNKWAVTAGGGFLNNPGRYLVLLPPIRGASATDNSCADCFTQNPGDSFRAWDYTLTLDFMPDDLITYRLEFNHREANTPYFAGPKGITSDNGNNNSAPSAGWGPDLVKSNDRINLAMMLRF